MQMEVDIEFPPSFDINYCRAAYPQLKDFSDEELTKYFLPIAEEEGLPTCVYDKREFLQPLLQEGINQYALKVLEIGPFDNPFLSGDSVKYFDVLDTEKLKERAKIHNRSFNRTPPKVHYVEPTGNLKIVYEKFDIVFSSHVIEHQPNLIRELNHVENILNDGGLYILFIPDKRYCFDYYRPTSKLSDVLSAFMRNASLHSAKSIAEHFCMTTHNNPINHWRGDHGELNITKEKILNAKNVYEKSVHGGGYVDVHAWAFTPQIFGDIIEKLNRLDLINLKLYRLCHTLIGRQEFCCILKKIL